MAKSIEQLQSEADAAQKKAAEAKKKLRLAKLAATKKEREQNRKNDTRRKITFGAFMLNKVKQKNPESEKLYNEFLASLTKKQDREIFNLEPLPDAEKA